LEYWALLNRSTSLDPSCKVEPNFLSSWHTFSVYIHESWTLGKPCGIKMRCYWECLHEQLRNLRNLKGTWWEPLGTNKKQHTKECISTFVFMAFKDVLWIYYFPHRWRISGFAFSILWCSQTGNYPQKDLAKFGYRPDMKVF
jgi:hypothetical protein